MYSNIDECMVARRIWDIHVTFFIYLVVFGKMQIIGNRNKCICQAVTTQIQEIIDNSNDTSAFGT